MENISNTFFLLLYMMVTDYVLVVACAEEGSLNISSDRVTEEILYCSESRCEEPPKSLTGSNPAPRAIPLSPG